MLETNGKFYLGRLHDLAKGKTTEKPLLYDPDDLTTHAVVVGMTGSGKTGLCIDLLEEAALNDIPAIMIDPKGDITNALLHFPELLPADFQPWVDADQARREDKSVEEVAAKAAATWEKGLKDWGIEKDRIQALADAAEFAIYTPGSDAGIPINTVSVLKAPKASWEKHKEEYREQISGAASALLGLVGMDDVDPVRSREHILIANIFEQAWSSGQDVDLTELILQVQNPPFEKLGAFDLEAFYPEKERFELAMLLNNILAAPAFEAWRAGVPLDIASILHTPDGRPRHSVFYIAHLSDAERMFFVTLLYSAIETWMRQQSGSNALRAIVYFDEIYGYVPPTANPPSKLYMLRLLKMARAFGVAQVLVTQNPVDLDYKGLSNAGTWFIGKLQTERDKQRLMDGLAGVGSVDTKKYDALISKLSKRVFLLHNIHEKEPQVFYTRWAMNYLPGPLTRAQIPALNALAGTSTSTVSKRPSAPKRGSAKPTSPDASFSTTRPALPSGIDEYFLPHNLTLAEAARAEKQSIPDDAKSQGLLYRPVLLAQAGIRYLQRKYNLDYQQSRTALVLEADRRGAVRWEDFPSAPIDSRSLDRAPERDARFASLEAPLTDPKQLKSLESDFLDWAYRTGEVQVWANEELKVYAGPELSEGDFRKLCSEAAREARDAEIKRTEAKYKSKIEALQKKLAREKRELAEDETELSQRKMEEMGTHLENVIGLFGGSRRRVSTSLTKRRLTAQAKADVEESVETISEIESDLAELAEEIEDALEEIHDRWGEVANDLSQIPVAPYKKDVRLDLFGVAWFPYHLLQSGNRPLELPAFSPE